MSRLASATADTMLDAGFVTGTTYYLGLNTGDPGSTGANEVTGGTYARQAITFAAASGGSKLSSDSQSFTGMPAVTGGTPYYSVWDASTAGNYKGGGSMSNLSVDIPAGATVDVASGAIDLGQS